MSTCLQEIDCYLLDNNGYVVLSKTPSEVITVCCSNLFIEIGSGVWKTVAEDVSLRI